MRKTQKLFRTRVFGGYNKSDVDRYVRRLEEELTAHRRELDEREEENEKNQKLIEEAIRELRSLREESGRLRGRRDPKRQ